jgi:kinesin family protein 3/17
VGGENLLEKAEVQAKLLEQSEKELEQQRLKQKNLKQVITEKEEEKLQLEEKYANLNEEAQSKTKKLKKLRTMILQCQSELKDIETEHQRAMEGLLESVRDLDKELKLQIHIINSYIPAEFQGVIGENVAWNEELGEWQLKCVAYTGNNMRKQKDAEVDKDKLRNLDFDHLFLNYTVDSAEKSMRDRQRGKSAKKKKTNKSVVID